ncbi:MAG: hypothetical protein BRC33_06290 [Cyanobacteria bacterium SW_9_44_58]|nr:MAG: hypothetical protein BRC33_06290 [Cyanobacteria bacterium SW_9_44_58]
MAQINQLVKLNKIFLEINFLLLRMLDFFKKNNNIRGENASEVCEAYIKMSLKTIQQIGFGIFCFAVIAFSSVAMFASSAIALPQSGQSLAAMEEMAEDATEQVQQGAENAKKAVEKGVDKADQKAEEAQKAIQGKAEEGMEKAQEGMSETEEEEGIVDKVKKLFTGK